jgi:enoyl-CoA hydratase/3-hydroxyacyl-CoA dehydrogenase
MDQMDKPVVAAINGMALGGGLEIAIRCHGMVATPNARFQFPEVTLGILPGIGGCIVPYRKWAKGAILFHEMICLGKPISADKALEIGMLNKISDDYAGLIDDAVETVNRLQGNIQRISGQPAEIADIVIADPPMAGKQSLSREAVAIIVKTIKEGAVVDTFSGALEVGYTGFGEIACTKAAKEGISAFLEKRKPEFTK